MENRSEKECIASVSCVTTEKQPYVAPEIEIIEFDREDVITTSGQGYGGNEGNT